MNIPSVLFVLYTPGEPHRQALIPLDQLDDYDLDAIDGHIVNWDDDDELSSMTTKELTEEVLKLDKDERRTVFQEVGKSLTKEEDTPPEHSKDSWQGQIIDIYRRLGLEKSDWTDFAPHLKVHPPFTVDRVIFIGWAT